jgi:hypothetical protein
MYIYIYIHIRFINLCHIKSFLSKAIGGVHSRTSLYVHIFRLYIYFYYVCYKVLILIIIITTTTNITTTTISITTNICCLNCVQLNVAICVYMYIPYTNICMCIRSYVYMYIHAYICEGTALIRVTSASSYTLAWRSTNQCAPMPDGK